MALDLNKQRVLDDEPRVLKQIFFTVNFDKVSEGTLSFILEKNKKLTYIFELS